MISVRALRVAAATMFAFAVPSLALAQAGGPPNALQGFSQNRDQPVKIDATTLEVRNRNQTATFSGNVHVVQGDTTLRCGTLAVLYEGDAGRSTMVSVRPGPGGQTRIKRLEAKGGVIVIQKDQIATGNTGVFDMASNTVTLSGNVIVKQGESVLRGDRLVVDLTTGVAKIESSGSFRDHDRPQRIQAIFSTSSIKGSVPDQKSDREGAVVIAAREKTKVAR